MGFSGPTRYREDVRDYFACSFLNQLILLPNVGGFLELVGNTLSLPLLGGAGAPGGLPAVREIDDRVPVG